jgi:outer membrane protein OmpA-like peptidoglycan-associated protein
MNKLINLKHLFVMILVFSYCVSGQTSLHLLFEEVSTALAQAKAAHADVLCKDKYEEACEFYNTALGQKNNEYETSDIVENLENAISSITLLNESIDEKQSFFYDVLQSREDALENGAKENAEYFFDEAESRLASAINNFEDGDLNDARNELPGAIDNYNQSIKYSDLSRSLQFKWLPYNNANLVFANKFAPIEYNSAMEHFNSALNLINDGSDMMEVETEIISAEEKFNLSITKANKFSNRYPALIAARNEALDANADQVAFTPWNFGEVLLTTLASNETEEEVADQDDVAEIILQYKIAESEAFKYKFLNEANRKITSAEKLNADDYSPVSYTSGVTYIDRASKMIEGENFRKSQITRLADESIQEANKAILISQIIQSVENGETTWEDVLLSWNIVVSYRKNVSRPDPIEDESEIFPDPEIVSEPLQSEYVGVYTDVFTDEEAEIIDEDDRLIIHLIGLNYEAISTKLEFAQRDLLDKVITKMKQYPGSTFKIVGHTDNIGLRADNQKISEQRAKNVYDYIVNNTDVREPRISHSGQGETNPIADNRTQDGRQKNRRVDVIIIK